MTAAGRQNRESSAQAKRYRALRNLALRQSPDPDSPLFEQWFEWPAGTVFEAPTHMNAKLMLASGKIEKVGRGEE